MQPLRKRQKSQHVEGMEENRYPVLVLRAEREQRLQTVPRAKVLVSLSGREAAGMKMVQLHCTTHLDQFFFDLEAHLREGLPYSPYTRRPD